MMNKQQFEQEVFADPNALSDDAQHLLNSSDEYQQIYADVQKLNQDIKETLEIPVPEGLQQALLNISKADTDRHHTTDNVVSFSDKFKNTVIWSLAASVVLAVGLSFSVFNPNQDDMTGSEMALAHFHHENPYSLSLSDEVSLAEVNTKLASFNAQLSSKVGRITYANYCFFGNEKSVHMVLDTVFGKVTMFVTAKDKNRPIDQIFGDAEYEGHSWSIEDIDITIINKKGQNNTQELNDMKNYIEYSA